MSCGAKVPESSGGNALVCPAPCGTAVPAVLFVAMAIYPGPLPALGKEQEEGNQQRENAERFGNGKAKDQAAELPIGSGWIAQRALQKLAKKIADADRGSTGANGSKAGADEFCGCGIHGLLFSFVGYRLERRASTSAPDVAHR